MGLKLWVDDLREAPKGWVCVRTVTEAIRFLDTQGADEVSLDHDICHTEPARPCTCSGTDMCRCYGTKGMIVTPRVCLETFEPVARFIAVEPGIIKRVHIHTSNPAGAERMAEIISNRQPHIKLSRRLGKIYEEADEDCKVDDGEM